MKTDKLEEAMTALEMTSRQQFRSDPEMDEAIRKQYEYVIHVLVDEVQSLKRVVKSICDDRP